MSAIRHPSEEPRIHAAGIATAQAARKLATTIFAVLGLANVQAQQTGSSISNSTVVQSSTNAFAVAVGNGTSLSQAGSFQIVGSTTTANASTDGSYAIGHADATGMASTNGRSYARNASVGNGGGEATANGAAIVNVSASTYYGTTNVDYVSGTVDGTGGSATEFRVYAGRNGAALTGGGNLSDFKGTSDATRIRACPPVTFTATTMQPTNVVTSGPTANFSGPGQVNASYAGGSALVTSTAVAVTQGGCSSGNS